MEILIGSWVGAGIATGALGAWVASQRQRDPVEGFVLGFAFSVFGVLVEAMLPVRTQSGSVFLASPIAESRAANERADEYVDWIENEYREYLDAKRPDWRALSYHRKRALCGKIEKRLRKKTTLPPVQFVDFANEARRRLLRG